MADKKKVVTAEQMLVTKSLTVTGTLTATDIAVTDDMTMTDDLTVEGTIAANGGLVTDTIAEETSAAGVTIDGALVKDGHFGTRQAITGDGAITIQTAQVILSKGSAAAITIVAPTSGTHDGIEIIVIAATAQAHVITCATDGFNAKGASGTVTFGGAIGDSVVLRADTGHWYTVAGRNYTPA